MPAEVPAVGLRERKKAKTRAAIQSHALRLFREQGYEATTVQQIIEEAEVSESTFFRYFPTKADVVLTDEFDPVIVEAFRRQPPELRAIEALRRAFQESFAQLSPEDNQDQRERTALALAVPELRGAMLDQFGAAIQLVNEVVAERVGRPVGDPEVRTLGGAVIGAAVAAMFAMVDQPDADLAAIMDEAMACLERGFLL